MLCHKIQSHRVCFTGQLSFEVFKTENQTFQSCRNELCSILFGNSKTMFLASFALSQWDRTVLNGYKVCYSEHDNLCGFLDMFAFVFCT